MKSVVPYPLIEHIVRENIKAHSDALASDDSETTMGTPKLDGITWPSTAPQGGSSLVSIGNISEQGPRPLLINIHDC